MPSLLGTDVTTNYNRLAGPNYTVSDGTRTYVGPFTNFGTRQLKFLVVTFNNGSDSDIDLTKGYASATDTFAGSYTDSNSYLSKVVRTAQTFVEVWAVGVPTATDVVLVVSADTANSSESGNGTVPIATTYGLMEAAILTGVGTGAKAGLATAYNGTVVVSNYALVGATLATASEPPFYP